MLSGGAIGHIVNDCEEFLNVLSGGDEERAIIDLLKAEFVKNFLGLGSSGSRLFDSGSHDEGVDLHVLVLGED